MTLLPDGRYHLAATFVGNSISVFGTTFVTMPLSASAGLAGGFYRKKLPGLTTQVGLGILAALFAIEVGALWSLLPW
jgi:hypothetical protein